jgi:hypothetical protein
MVISVSVATVLEASYDSSIADTAEFAMRVVLYAVIIALTSAGIILLINGWRIRRRAIDVVDATNFVVPTHTGASIPIRVARNRYYVANTMLLHPVEHQFTMLLNDILPREYRYTVRVAMNRLVKVKQLRHTHAWRNTHWSRIAQKSIDVVVMRASDTKPVLVVLFEDNRYSGSTVVRDAFVASVLREVKLPVVYVAISTMHIREAIQQQILPFLVPVGE